MKNKNLNQLHNNELFKQLKKIKNYKLINAVMIGFIIGILFYGTVKNRLGTHTILPLLLLGGAAKTYKNNRRAEEEINAEIQSRGL